MVSNSKDDHPSKATPIMNVVPNIHPKTVMQVHTHLSVGNEKNSLWHKEVYSLMKCTLGFHCYCFHFGQSTMLNTV